MNPSNSEPRGGSSSGGVASGQPGIVAQLDSIDLFAELESLEEENASLADANRKLREEKRDVMVKLSHLVWIKFRRFLKVSEFDVFVLNCKTYFWILDSDWYKTSL